MATTRNSFRMETRRQVVADIHATEKSNDPINAWHKEWSDWGHIKIFKWVKTEATAKSVSLGTQRELIRPLTEEEKATQEAERLRIIAERTPAVQVQVTAAEDNKENFKRAKGDDDESLTANNKLLKLDNSVNTPVSLTPEPTPNDSLNPSPMNEMGFSSSENTPVSKDIESVSESPSPIPPAANTTTTITAATAAATTTTTTSTISGETDTAITITTTTATIPSDTTNTVKAPSVDNSKLTSNPPPSSLPSSGEATVADALSGKTDTVSSSATSSYETKAVSGDDVHMDTLSTSKNEAENLKEDHKSDQKEDDNHSNHAMDIDIPEPESDETKQSSQPSNPASTIAEKADVEVEGSILNEHSPIDFLDETKQVVVPPQMEQAAADRIEKFTASATSHEVLAEKTNKSSDTKDTSLPKESNETEEEISVDNSNKEKQTEKLGETTSSVEPEKPQVQESAAPTETTTQNVNALFSGYGDASSDESDE